MTWLRVRPALALALALSGCDGTISVVFSTGRQELEVSTASLALPTELRGGDGTIASVSCGPMGMCPPSDAVTLECVGGVCDPAPRTISVPVGGVIDADALLSEAGEVGLRVVDSYAVERVRYEVSLNTLTVPVGEIAVFWGPEAATSIDPALGVRRFGTVPPIAAGATPSGELTIDGEGAAALSDHLVSTSRRVRFFAQTEVDLAPGDPFPEGSVRASVNATIRAVGRLVR
ncbi:MAG: hypothetical protein KF729_06220 [Sandaracinaceae bacterium]|nr:hypothetical protein [Sandaracinaceae bacterium]